MITVLCPKEALDRGPQGEEVGLALDREVTVGW
jgi:hypothetical protein